MKHLLSWVFICFSVVSTGQVAENVVLKKPKKATYPYSQVEPSIAIHPKDSSIIIAGSVLSDYYYSKDGGKTWTSKTLKSSYGVNGDPVMIFDTTGKVFYFHLAKTKDSYLDRIVCQSAKKPNKRFNDGTFPAPTKGKFQDKHWVVLNEKTNELFMTWTQFDAYSSDKVEDTSIIVFSKSKDQGKTWSNPLRISTFGGDCVDSDNTVEGAVPAIGPNGEVYVTWTGPKGLVFQQSLDGGLTWMKEEQLLMEHVEGWDLEIPGLNRANGLPILMCDVSEGPNRGTLYLNWCDQKNGKEDTDSWVLISRDGGKSWSDRIRVNQDSSKQHQFFTWMTIDQSNGNLYFVYYDRRNYTDNQTDVYMTVSNDGGRTFKDYKLSDSPFLPDDKMFFGDYLNISAANGQISAIWPRLDFGQISLLVSTFNQRQLK